MAKLYKLSIHNKLRLKELQQEYPKPNGLGCDKCGNELEDLSDVIAPGYPRKIRVRCPECKVKYFRYLSKHE